MFAQTGTFEDTLTYINVELRDALNNIEPADEPRDEFHAGCCVLRAYSLLGRLNELHAKALAAQPEARWQPIETWKQNDDVIMRPHRIWGAMDVRYKPASDRPKLPWLNGDYTTSWPEEAFLPFWMPLPLPPSAPKEKASPFPDCSGVLQDGSKPERMR